MSGVSGGGMCACIFAAEFLLYNYVCVSLFWPV